VDLGTLEGFRQTGEVDATRQGTITSIVDEEFVRQADRGQGDVRVVHGLEADAFLGALEVGSVTISSVAVMDENVNCALCRATYRRRAL
jgi:hypothetical protein